MGGHAGILKTFLKISANFYWLGMKEDIRKFVADYYVCKIIKSPTSKVAGLLQPLPILEQVWEDLTMDFITGLPKSKDCTVILVVVDRLSKAAHFKSLPSSFAAVSVANLFTNMVVKHHGFSSLYCFRQGLYLSQQIMAHIISFKWHNLEI